MSLFWQKIMAKDSEKQTVRPLVLAAIILAMFMAAIEGTIVATAMPGIVSDLGGFSLYSWVFSAFLLMQAVTILIYGKLSDLFGRKPVFVFGIVTFLIGSLLLGATFFVLLSPSLGPVWAGTASFLIGVGMGLTSTTFIVAIQSSVDWKTRGVATASNMFMRIVGNALGAAMLGGILNGRLKAYFSKHGDLLDDSLTIDAADVLLNEEERSRLSQEVLAVLQDGLTVSLHSVYWGLLILAIVTFAFILFLPKPKH